MLPGPRGVNSQADTVPASQLKRFCRWSVCPVGPVAQEKNHLIIFYFFLTLTPNHCNTSEQMPGNSEAAVRSGGCSELSCFICVSLLPPGFIEPHLGEASFLLEPADQIPLGETAGLSSLMCGGSKMTMHFLSLLRSGLSVTEATSLAWECPASVGQVGFGSFSCLPHPKTLAAHINLGEGSEGFYSFRGGLAQAGPVVSEQQGDATLQCQVG